MKVASNSYCCSPPTNSIGFSLSRIVLSDENHQSTSEKSNENLQKVDLKNLNQMKKNTSESCFKLPSFLWCWSSASSTSPGCQLASPLLKEDLDDEGPLVARPPRYSTALWPLLLALQDTCTAVEYQDNGSNTNSQHGPEEWRLAISSKGMAMDGKC